MNLILYIVLFLMVVAIPVLLVFDHRNARMGPAYMVAKKIFDRHVKVFEAERSEYRMVSLASFPDVDVGFYDATTRELETQGFCLLGDIENISLVEATNLQSPMRVMVDHTRSFVVYFVDVYNPRRKQHRTLIDFTTEFSDNRFLETTNLADRGLICSPHIQMHRIPDEVSAKALFTVHHNRFEEYRTQNPGVDPKTFNSMQDVIEGWSRSRILSVAYRKTLSAQQLRQAFERFTAMKKRDPIFVTAVAEEYEKLYERYRAKN